MTPQEKQQMWQRTLTALEQRDARVHLAILVAMILRHGNLEQCGAGHTHVVERITIEDLIHVVNKYAFATRVPEYGVIEIQAVAKGEIDESIGRPYPLA